MTDEGFLYLIGLGTILVNLAILGLTLKLYTEYFKDRSQHRRTAKDGG